MSATKTVKTRRQCPRIHFSAPKTSQSIKSARLAQTPLKRISHAQTARSQTTPARHAFIPSLRRGTRQHSAILKHPESSQNSHPQTHAQTNAPLTPKSTTTATCSRIQSRRCNRTISAAAVFDSVSSRVLLSCRWPPHPSRCIVSVANNQRRLVNFCECK